MQDLQTKSLWSQVSGVCIQGEMIGKTLVQIPAIHTTYAEFAKDHPDGLLLEKEEKGEMGSHYDGYFAADEKLGIFGRVDNFKRLTGKTKVFGLRLARGEIAISRPYLSQHGFAIVDSSRVIVTYDTPAATAAAFALDGVTDATLLRVIEGRIITGENADASGVAVSWDASTGRVIEGPGDDLRAVPLVTAFWFAWASFFPETELVP